MMGIGTIISESLHFTRATLVDTWSRWLIFIVLGIPWLVLSYVIDTSDIIDGTTIHWEQVPWMPIVALVVAGIVCSFFISGYFVRLLRGGTKPPEFDRWSLLAVEGIKLDILIILWIIPVLLIIFLPILFLYAGLLTGGVTGEPGFLFMLPGLFIIDVGLLIFIIMFGIIGIIRFTRTGCIGEGLAIPAIKLTIRRIGWINYIAALFVLLITGIFFFIISVILHFIPEAGMFIAACMAPFFTVFQYRILAQVYDTQEPAPIPGSGFVPSDTSQPQTGRSTVKYILIWIGVMGIILAVILIPLYFMLGSIMFPIPSLTTSDLQQAQNDDISIYVNNSSFADPQFTHDGKSIVFIETTRPTVMSQNGSFSSSTFDSNIWIMNRTGNYQTQLTSVNDISDVFLDPTFDKMAYDRYGNGKMSVYIKNGTAAHPFCISGPIQYMYFSSWSPDGKRFAATGLNQSDTMYKSFMPDGNDVPSTGTEWARLYVMNADGSSAKDFVNVSTGMFPLRTESSWSPDGTHLVAPLYMPGNFGLGVIDASTGSILEVTRAVDQSGPKFTRREDTYPRWSPAGDWIAFLREGDVYLVKPDGTGLKNLTADGTINALTWSPDGSRLAFSADHYLGIIDPDGTNLIRIANIQPGPMSWSPDGQTLVYTPGIGVRIRIMTLSPGVIKMGEFETNQLEAMAKVMATPT
jgi:Tol biopolymer transport system component